jgi:hypothetical protein
MIVALVWLYDWALGEYVFEPMNEDYKIKYTKTFKIKYMMTLIFCFQCNEASVLDHIVPTTFSIYSVELELCDRKVCSAHLC